MVLELSPKPGGVCRTINEESCAFPRGKLTSTSALGAERGPMTVFDEHRDELEHYETMMGLHRGRLAVSLDLLTNALVLVGQHGVYCQSQRYPDTPAMDIRIVTKELAKAKELIQSVMEELRKEHP